MFEMQFSQIDRHISLRRAIRRFVRPVLLCLLPPAGKNRGEMLKIRSDDLKNLTLAHIRTVAQLREIRDTVIYEG